MSGDETAIRFTAAAVRRHVVRWHPACPEGLCDDLVAALLARTWADCSLGKAFGIVASGHVRHRLTDYDWLRNGQKMSREEARRIVYPKINAIIESWSGVSRQERIAAAAARGRRRRRRQRLAQTASPDASAPET